MKEAILKISTDPEIFFDLQTNGLNKVQIEIGIRAALKALQDEIDEDAKKAVGDNWLDQRNWIKKQWPK